MIEDRQIKFLYESLMQYTPPPQNIRSFLNEFLNIVQKMTQSSGMMMNMSGRVYRSKDSIFDRIMYYVEAVALKLAKDVFILEEIADPRDAETIFKDSMDLVAYWWYYGFLKPISIITLGDGYGQYLLAKDHPKIPPEQLFENRFQILHFGPEDNLELVMEHLRSQLHVSGKSPQDIFNSYLVDTIPPVELFALMDVSMIAFYATDGLAELKKEKSKESRDNPHANYEKVHQIIKLGGLRLIHVVFGPYEVIKLDSAEKDLILQDAYTILLIWYAAGILTPLNFDRSKILQKIQGV